MAELKFGGNSMNKLNGFNVGTYSFGFSKDSNNVYSLSNCQDSVMLIMTLN